METWLSIPIIIILILAIVLYLAPIIIIFQLNDIKQLLRKINKNLSPNTAESNSNEDEDNTTDNQRTKDLM